MPGDRTVFTKTSPSGHDADRSAARQKRPQPPALTGFSGTSPGQLAVHRRRDGLRKRPRSRDRRKGIRKRKESGSSLAARRGPWSVGLVTLLAAAQTSGLAGCATFGILRRPRLSVSHAKTQRWLRSGPQTQVTPKIRALAWKLRASTRIQTLRNIHRWVTSHATRYKGNRAEVLRRRTASELLEDRTLSGCGDWGVLLAALFRAAGIPTIYVEAVDWHWARQWVDGSDVGPHLGHVFLEVYVKGKWRLVDSTRGWLWTDYDPAEPSLPLHHYAFAKGLDAWDLGLKSFSALRATLEHIAEYLDSVKIRDVSYRRHFLTPTVLLLADAKTIAERHRVHRSVYFKHRRTGALAGRTPERQLEGIDTLVSIVAGKPDPAQVAEFLGLSKSETARIEQVVAACAGRHRCRRALYLQTPSRRVCVAVTASPKALVPFLHSLLSVRPGNEHALSSQACQVHIKTPEAVRGRTRPHKSLLKDDRPAGNESPEAPSSPSASRAVAPPTKPATREKPGEQDGRKAPRP